MEQGQEKASPAGLRYRKKLKARLAVERAALELVIERGYDGVTVEDICARAEISKKPFFNYFPSKASVIMGRMDAFQMCIRDRPRRFCGSVSAPRCWQARCSLRTGRWTSWCSSASCWRSRA